MSIKLLDSHKNVGNFLKEEINKNKYHIIFLDWDDTVIYSQDLSRYKFTFRNENNKKQIIESFKEAYENEFCLGIYILTYRPNLFDVEAESNELGINKYLKSDLIIYNNDKYSRIGPCISVNYECPKIVVLEEIVNKDKKISNNINIYFLDDNLQNITTSFFTTKYNDNLFLYYFPTPETNKNFINRIEHNKNKILKYIDKK